MPGTDQGASCQPPAWGRKEWAWGVCPHHVWGPCLRQVGTRGDFGHWRCPVACRLLCGRKSSGQGRMGGPQRVGGSPPAGGLHSPAGPAFWSLVLRAPSLRGLAPAWSSSASSWPPSVFSVTAFRGPGEGSSRGEEGSEAPSLYWGLSLTQRGSKDRESEQGRRPQRQSVPWGQATLWGHSGGQEGASPLWTLPGTPPSVAHATGLASLKYMIPGEWQVSAAAGLGAPAWFLGCPLGLPSVRLQEGGSVCCGDGAGLTATVLHLVPGPVGLGPWGPRGSLPCSPWAPEPLHLLLQCLIFPLQPVQLVGCKRH